MNVRDYITQLHAQELMRHRQSIGQPMVDLDVGSPGGPSDDPWCAGCGCRIWPIEPGVLADGKLTHFDFDCAYLVTESLSDSAIELDGCEPPCDCGAVAGGYCDLHRPSDQVTEGQEAWEAEHRRRTEY